MTHASPDCENPRSRWIEGRATFTIVMSTTISRNPVQRTISESQREFFMPFGRPGSGKLIGPRLVRRGEARLALLGVDRSCRTPMSFRVDRGLISDGEGR